MAGPKDRAFPGENGVDKRVDNLVDKAGDIQARWMSLVRTWSLRTTERA
jgi:hypothetical protein